MAKRLVALAVLASLGYVVWAVRQGADAGDAVLQEPVVRANPCEDPDVVGVKPDGAPKFHVDRELRMVGERQVMFLTITESHGWYADYVYVRLRFEETDENGKRRMVGNAISYLMKGYIDFGKTLEDHTTLLPFEFGEELEDLGTTEDWHVKVVQWGKVLAPKRE